MKETSRADTFENSAPVPDVISKNPMKATGRISISSLLIEQIQQEVRIGLLKMFKVFSGLFMIEHHTMDT